MALQYRLKRFILDNLSVKLIFFDISPQLMTTPCNYCFPDFLKDTRFDNHLIRTMINIILPMFQENLWEC